MFRRIYIYLYILFTFALLLSAFADCECSSKCENHMLVMYDQLELADADLGRLSNNLESVGNAIVIFPTNLQYYSKEVSNEFLRVMAEYFDMSCSSAGTNDFPVVDKIPLFRRVCSTNITAVMDVNSNMVFVTNIVCGQDIAGYDYQTNYLSNPCAIFADTRNDMDVWYAWEMSDFLLNVVNDPNWNNLVRNYVLATQEYSAAVWKVNVVKDWVDDYENICSNICDDCASSCSASGRVESVSNCVVACIYTNDVESCITNCTDDTVGPSSNDCVCAGLDALNAQMEHLRDLLEEISQRVKYLYDLLDDYFQKMKIFADWVDDYSKHDWQNALMRRWNITPKEFSSVSADNLTTNYLYHFSAKPVEEELSGLNKNFFHDSILMGYYQFEQLNLANAILASLSTNLGERVESTTSESEITNSVVEVIKSVPTNNVPGFSEIQSNMFDSALSSVSNMLPTLDWQVSLPTTFAVSFPWEFHNNNMSDGIVRRDLEFDISDYTYFFEILRGISILFYVGFLVFLFWVIVRFVYLILFKVLHLGFEVAGDK